MANGDSSKKRKGVSSSSTKNGKGESSTKKSKGESSIKVFEGGVCTVYEFRIQAKFFNVDQVEAAGDGISYYFKMRCVNCTTETEKEVAAKLELKDHRLPNGVPCNMQYKCKFCHTKGWVLLDKTLANPLKLADTADYTNKGASLMGIRAYGFILFDPSLNGGFKASKGELSADAYLGNSEFMGSYSNGTPYGIQDIILSLHGTPS